MKEEVMQKLGAILNALNIITVNGKSNLVNLSGSIAVIEEVMTMLNKASFESESVADDK